MQLYDLAYELSYRADLQIIVLRWLRPSGIAESQESYEAAFALARQHRCGRWLLDGRRRGIVDLALTKWLADYFFTEVGQHLLPKQLKLGVLTSPDRQNQISADAVLAAEIARALAPGPLSYQTYVGLNEGQVLDWLLTESSR